MTDREAFDRMRQGDKAGFFWMFMQYEAEFTLWINRSLNCPHVDAEKIFEDASLAAFQKIREDKAVYSSSLKTYLFTIGKYKWYEELRRRQKTADVALSLHESVDYDEEEETRIAQMERAVGQLGDKCRELLDMRILQAVSYESIVSKMGYKNVDSVKTAKHKCLEQLRRLMQAFH